MQWLKASDPPTNSALLVSNVIILITMIMFMVLSS